MWHLSGKERQQGDLPTTNPGLMKPATQFVPHQGLHGIPISPTDINKIEHLLSATLCLALQPMLHLHGVGPKVKECDPPQNSLGSNDLHAEATVQVLRVQLSFTGGPSSRSSAGLSSYPSHLQPLTPNSGQRGPPGFT